MEKKKKKSNYIKIKFIIKQYFKYIYILFF